MNLFSRHSLALCLFASVAFTPATLLAHGDAKEKAAPNSFGQPGVLTNHTRTIAISMTDAMRFNPASLKFNRGETVRLRITNLGKVPHEFVLGTQKEIEEHAEMMRQMPGMIHADANSARVAPGKSADIVWQFSTSGKFLYACLIAGHWEAGMAGHVTVTDPVQK